MTTPFDAKQLLQGVDAAAFKALFQINPVRHALAIVFNWIIIAAAIFLTLQYPLVPVYCLAIIVIGARMHALAILTHDATHFRFLKNRYWNDLLTNLFSMYPVFSSIEKYRANHLTHHQHLNTEDDPDWVAKLGKRGFTFPQTRTEFVTTILSYIVLYQGISDAIWFFKRFGRNKSTADNKENGTVRLAYYLSIVAILTVFGWWTFFLLFWIVPYLSFFFLFQYIRSVAEHYGEMAYEDELTATRTVLATPLEEFLIAPHNVGYHLEHHLFPGVPFYNLPKLHRLLMSQPDYAKQAHVTRGYTFGLLKELGHGKKKVVLG